MNEMSKVQFPQLPDYLQEYVDNSKEELSRHLRFPGLYIVREKSKLEEAGIPAGSVYESTGRNVVLDPGSTFHFVPLFYFESYKVMYDRARKEENPVKEFTLDHNSPIAKKARLPMPKARVEVDEEMQALRKTRSDGSPMLLTYVETLNYYCYLPFRETEFKPNLLFDVVLLSFDKGEYATGAGLARMISSRLSVPMPACLVRASLSQHVNRKDRANRWLGFDFDWPDTALYQEFVQDEKAFKARAEWREKLKQAYAERILDVSDAASSSSYDDPSSDDSLDGSIDM